MFPVKHFRILLPLLILALVLSGCSETVREPYEYTFSGKTITVYPETNTITDGLDVYTYDIEQTQTRTHYVIHYPNGATFNWTSTEYGGSGGWSDDYNEILYIRGNVLISALEQSQPRQRVGNVGLGLLLMGMGAVNFFAPEFVFYFSRGWMYRDAEPSDAYITWTKVCGAVAAIVGLVYSFI